MSTDIEAQIGCASSCANDEHQSSDSTPAHG